MDRLARHLRDGVEVGVIVQDDETLLLSRSCHKQVRDLSPTLAPFGEESLDLKCAPDVIGGRFNKDERLECLVQPTPLIPVPSS